MHTQFMQAAGLLCTGRSALKRQSDPACRVFASGNIVAKEISRRNADPEGKCSAALCAAGKMTAASKNCSPKNGAGPALRQTLLC